MKKLIAVVVAIAAILLTNFASDNQGAAAKAKNKFEGTWELISHKYGDNENFTDFPKAQKRLKHITDTHYTWLDYDVETKLVTSAIAGGRYTLEGDMFTQLNEYAGDARRVFAGKQATYACRVDGDKWHLSGKTSSGTKLEEIWQRVNQGDKSKAKVKVEGTWELISYKYGESENFADSPKERKCLKHITDTHYTWLDYDVETKLVTSAIAGGRYTLEGDVFTQQNEYAGEAVKSFAGKQATYTCKVDGDKWHHSGKLSNGLKIEQIWQRVK